jgi:hypothetical protein
MDEHKYDPNPEVEDLERKADELVSLMFDLCEEQVNADFKLPDACAPSLASAAMAVREAIQTFLTLKRIL